MPRVIRDGVALWWAARGSGQPVLLIAGLGYSSDMWWRLLPDLSARHRTVRFDNRGVGRTGVCPPGPHRLEVMADDAAAVLQAAGVDSAHVVGISMGGTIAQELALRHPERVRSLVLAATSCNGAEAVPLDDAAARLMLNRVGMPVAEAARAAVPFVYAPDTPRSRVEEDIAVRLLWPTEPAGYAAQLRGIGAHGGTRGRLDRVAVPTLVLHGAQDRLVPPANAQVIAGAIAGARLVILDGASHLLLTDQPDRTRDLLLGWLAEVSGADPPPAAHRVESTTAVSTS